MYARSLSDSMDKFLGEQEVTLVVENEMYVQYHHYEFCGWTQFS